MREASNRLAGALRTLGLSPGDRIAILLPQSAAVVAAHSRRLQARRHRLPARRPVRAGGAAAPPVRFRGAGAESATRPASPRWRAFAAELPDLSILICVDGSAGALDCAALVAGASPDFAAADTGADDPALMIYTSGTTGLAKGALHAHRVLLGHMPGFAMMHDFPPKPAT